MACDDDRKTRVVEDWSELMDVEHTVDTLLFDDVPLAWRYLDDQYKKLRRAGFSYTALSIKEVA